MFQTSALQGGEKAEHSDKKHVDRGVRGIGDICRVSFVEAAGDFGQMESVVGHYMASKRHPV